MQNIHKYGLISLLLFCQQLFACDLTIRHIGPESVNDQRNLYFINMLQLALDKTVDSDGCYKLQALTEPLQQARALKSLDKNYGVDIVWSMTSIDRETQFLPVRIPLEKGLLGYRIFIIRRSDEARFAAIQNLQQLQSMLAGQGFDWPDTLILRANKLTVVEGSDYDGLFDMLQRNRFDYFPRGVNEPWAEISAHPDKDLMIEKQLLLHYVAPHYFFVGKQNTKLAERLKKGLLLAIKDGSFDKLFNNHPANKEIFNQAKISDRKIFELINPFLSAETPLDNDSLWFRP